MDSYREKQLPEDFLIAHLELHAGNYGGDVMTREICNKIGINYDTEASIIAQYLRGEELISWSSFDRVFLEPKGRKEAERIRDVRDAEVEKRVLTLMYDLGGANHQGTMMIEVLVQELPMPIEELRTYY